MGWREGQTVGGGGEVTRGKKPMSGGGGRRGWTTICGWVGEGTDWTTVWCGEVEGTEGWITLHVVGQGGVTRRLLGAGTTEGDGP